MSHMGYLGSIIGLEKRKIKNGDDDNVDFEVDVEVGLNVDIDLGEQDSIELKPMKQR